MNNFFKTFRIGSIILYIILYVGQISSIAQTLVTVPIDGQIEKAITPVGNGMEKRLSADIDNVSGKRVFVWQLMDGQNLATNNIYVSIYNPDMTLFFGPSIVNKTTAGDQIFPVVKVNQQDGSFVVAWSSWTNNANEYDIYAKKISFQNLTNDLASNDLLINDGISQYNRGRQILPKIAFDYNFKEVIIAWIDQDGQDSSPNGTPMPVDWGSFARRVNYAQNQLYLVPSSIQFGINSIKLNHQAVEDIAVSSSNGYLYTLCSSYGYGRKANNANVILNIFKRDDTGNFSNFLVERIVNSPGPDYSSSELGRLTFKSVTGDYYISWSLNNYSSGKSFVRGFDKDHQEILPEKRIFEYDGDWIGSLRLAIDDETNTFMAFYYQTPNKFNYRIYDYNFNAIGTAVEASSFPPSHSYDLFNVCYDQKLKTLLFNHEAYIGYCRQFRFNHPKYSLTTWSGKKSTDWFDSANWESNKTPGESDYVQINKVVTPNFQPIIPSFSIIKVRRLDMNNVTLTILGLSELYVSQELSISNTSSIIHTGQGVSLGKMVVGTSTQKSPSASIGTLGQNCSINIPLVIYSDKLTILNSKLSSTFLTESSSINIQSSIFSKSATIEKSGSGNDFCYGKNSFLSTAAIKNSGTGNLVFSASEADVFSSDVILSRSGDGKVEMAYTGVNIFGGNINVSGGVNFTSSGSGEVQLKGLNDQIIEGTGNVNFYTVIMNSPKTFTIKVPVSINKKLQVLDGKVIPESIISIKKNNSLNNNSLKN